MHNPRLAPRALIQALAALVAVAAVSLPAISSAHLGQTSASAERERVRSKRAEVASQVDTLRATDAEVEQALADLEANVRGQEALLAEAERAAAEARVAHEEAVAAVAAKSAEVDALKDDIRTFAVEAFIHPPANDALAALDADDPSDAAAKRALLELRNANDTDLLDRLRAAQEDLEVQQQLAAEAAERAEAKTAEVAHRLDEVRSARDERRQFAAEVQGRLDRALAESAALAELDKELSERIRREQQAAARRLAAASGGAAGTASVGRQFSSGNVSLATVSCPAGGSITVASSIAGSLQSLLNAAAADGVNLCGGGYRPSDSQIALRRANCGSSDYAIYQMPSSSCRPPTAPPGRSLHEQGLAVDFTCNGGGAISSRSSACFRWMAANAGSFGFRNLPSEPWHWSTTGG